MNKSGKIVCGIVLAILIAVVVIVMVVFSSLKIFREIKKLSKYSPDTIVKQGNEKLLALHWGEGFGDGSKNYEIEIYEDGKVIITYGNEWNGKNREKKQCKIDKEKIEELREAINDNAKNVTIKKTDRYDYGGTSIEIYEDGKVIYSFTDSWDKEANENFFNIAKKVKEIKDICEGK